MSLPSQQYSPWDCSTIPKLQLPAPMPSRRPAFLPSIGLALARIVWLSFHLCCHRSAVSLSASNISILTQTIAPLMGLDPSFSFPTHLRVALVLLTLPFSPLRPSSYWVLNGSIYSFPLIRSSSLLSAGVLHARLSEGVSLMYPWREMHSTSTYFSALSFSLLYCF